MVAEMNLDLLRYSPNGESSLGLLFVDKKFQCYTLEDERRTMKVLGHTRIPSGKYRVKFRKVEKSPKTIKYRNRFYWFTYHLMLQNVENFKYVYIHIGNKDDDTEGCILVGNRANNNTLIDGEIQGSAKAFEKLYRLISGRLELGETVMINVIDEDTILKLGRGVRNVR